MDDTLSLNNKKIILIGTAYFGYYKEIEQAIQKQGGLVTTFVDSPYDHYGINSLKKGYVRRKSMSYLCRKYTQYITEQTKDLRADYVFIVRGGDMLNDHVLSALKQTQPGARFVLYQWDSVKNFNYLPFVSYFDSISSFDPKDCREYNFNYVQLFALNSFYKVREQNTPKDIDITLLGFYHSNRLTISQAVAQWCGRQGLNYFVRLFMPLSGFIIQQVKTNIKGIGATITQWSKKYPGITFKSVPREAWLQLLGRSRFILDLPHVDQSGMTMRTFEALAAGCHLITTNRTIINEPFYDPEAITVLDVDQLNTFRLPAKTAMLDFRYYSIDNWIKRVLFN